MSLLKLIKLSALNDESMKDLVGMGIRSVEECVDWNNIKNHFGYFLHESIMTCETT